MLTAIRAASLAAIAALALTGCSGNSVATGSNGPTSTRYTPIYALTDCGDLQAEANKFYAKSDSFLAIDDLGNSRLAAYFAAAAEERMISLGC